MRPGFESQGRLQLNGMEEKVIHGFDSCVLPVAVLATEKHLGANEFPQGGKGETPKVESDCLRLVDGCAKPLSHTGNLGERKAQAIFVLPSSSLLTP